MTDSPRNAAIPRRCRSRPKQGVTLLEVAAVMAASIVLLGVTATALVAIQRADRQWTRRVDEARSRERLLSQMRRDVRAAQSFAWNPADASLRLTMADGGQLTYSHGSSQWERRLEPAADEEDDTAGNSAQAALTSAFPAPPDATWEVTPADGGVGDLIRIRILQPRTSPKEKHEDADVAELVVTVGRDWRLLHQ